MHSRHAGFTARIADSPRRARPCAPLPVCRRCFSHARRAATVRRTPSAVGAQAGAAPRRALPACWFSHGLPVAAAPPLHPHHLRTVRRPHPRPPHTTQAAHARLFPAACPGCWPLPPLASDGAQAAQLLGGHPLPRCFRSGRTPAARPPAPVGARPRWSARPPRLRAPRTGAPRVAFLQPGGRALAPCALFCASRCRSRRPRLRIPARRLAPFPPRGLAASPLPPSRLSPPYADY